MQATLDATSLRHLTRALTCLSRYGEDLTIYATPETLALSTTNSSQSAYCRFKYGRPFFSRYSVGSQSRAAGDVEEITSTSGQLLTKSLLSILKHKTMEKTVEKCELSITDGDSRPQGSNSDDEEDSLESKLTVRLHCKHGVIKTHRLLLLTPTALLAPSIPDAPSQSQLTIGPRALRDIVEHFPSSRGGKSDPQLVWSFGEADVQVRSIETSVDAKGKAQLATELTISADEFDNYEIFDIPITIAFHLREFNATIAFAETASLALTIRFTDPTEPLFIDLDGDLSDTLFVISTSQYGTEAAKHANRGARTTPNTNGNMQSRGKKRPLEDDTSTTGSGSALGSGSRSGSTESKSKQPVFERKMPMKVVQTTDRASMARELNGGTGTSTPRSMRGSMPPPSLPPPLHMRSESMPPPSLPPLLPIRSQSALAGPSGAFASRSNEPLFLPSSQVGEQELRGYGMGSQFERPQTQEPLFLPGTQLSQADQEAIRESGLGIENMTAEEFAAMLDGDGDGDEVEDEFDLGLNRRTSAEAGDQREDRETSLDIFDEMEIEMEPTQRHGMHKAFKPLFED